MARMVFGQMVEGLATAQAEHFTTSKLPGSKTACGITIKASRPVQTWKDWKLVTCKRCLEHKS